MKFGGKAFFCFKEFGFLGGGKRRMNLVNEND